MSTDRMIRSLPRLRDSASTARVLNLHSVWERHAENDPDHAVQPFFQHPLLNRGIIVKHRLRPHEYEDFETDRSVATKVIIPIDLNDLRAGARAFFVGQIGYEGVLVDLFGAKGLSTDRWADASLLEVLDGLPSLDPFLMRERLKKLNRTPARCYFDISDSDTAKMFDFLKAEISPLIGMSFGDLDVRLNEKTAKLASKILENAGDEELDPLRAGMGLDRPSFVEGVFCWKGFIYYKWVLSNLIPDLKPIAVEMASIRPVGRADGEKLEFVRRTRGKLVKMLARTCATVRETLNFYDAAYQELTHDGKPTAFRDFLLQAPALFHELGERLGSVQHIVSFWRFRFPAGRRLTVDIDELVELFADFEQSLKTTAEQEAA